MPRDVLRRARRLVVLAAVASCALTVTVAPLGAVADPIPSATQVRAAQQRAAAKAGEVGAIQAQLASAAAQLDQLQIAAQRAGQAYNAAVEKLDAAKVVATKATAADQAAQRRVVLARADVGSLARTQIQSSAPLVDLATLVSSAGPQQLIDQLDTFGSTSAVLQGKVTHLQRLEKAAKAAKQQATAAQAAVQVATDAANRAQQAATAAASAQAVAVAGYATRRTQLIGELARAQQVSVAVARQRQQGLEALARARAEAKRRAELKAQAERERVERQREAAAREAAHAAAERRAEERRQEAVRSRQRATREAAEKAVQRSTHHSITHHSTTHQSTTHSSTGGGSQQTSPVSTPTGGGGYQAGAAAQAIAFAKAQVGEPYVFGATGPNSWDCSGLTMRAYEQSGHEIGHFTGTQWGNVQHISQGALRPGDLLFWGDGSNPSSIYHTALYLGGGMMVQAPRPGRNVEIVSMYYWIPPNLFGRV